MTTNSRKWPKWFWLEAVFVISLCAIMLLLAANNSSAVPGLSTTFCVGMATTPRWQAGIAWVSPVSSYLPPLMISRYKLCVDLPPGLSPKRISGEFMLPP